MTNLNGNKSRENYGLKKVIEILDFSTSPLLIEGGEIILMRLKQKMDYGCKIERTLGNTSRKGLWIYTNLKILNSL